ncbi:hypothetical protein D9M68_784850 [compost metagenome]
MREPHGFPFRAHPFAVCRLFGGISQCRWRAIGPANRALCHTICALDPPFDVNIAVKALFARSGPDVFHRNSHNATWEHQRRDSDAVLMREFRARISPRQRGDRFRLTKQEAQHIEMMHAHVRQRQAVVIFEKALPMWDRAHLDGGHDRRAQLTLV